VTCIVHAIVLTCLGGATAAAMAALMSSNAVAQSAEAQATSQAAPKEKYRKDYKAPHRTITVSAHAIYTDACVQTQRFAVR
jgi:cellobiose-specific phosphotransferase system component IIB